MIIVETFTIDLVFDGLVKECFMRSVRDSQDEALRLEFSFDERHWMPFEWPRALQACEENELFSEHAA